VWIPDPGAFLGSYAQIAETLRRGPRSGERPDFAKRYAAFRRDMVYGESPEFETALATITALAGRLE
jgi:hypothetical protein